MCPGLQMPVFFFLGRHDHWVPPETSVAYFDALTAPSKKLVLVRGIRARAVRGIGPTVKFNFGGGGNDRVTPSR